jgi:hypothetical protein
LVSTVAVKKSCERDLRKVDPDQLARREPLLVAPRVLEDEVECERPGRRAEGGRCTHRSLDLADLDRRLGRVRDQRRGEQQGDTWYFVR